MDDKGTAPPPPSYAEAASQNAGSYNTNYNTQYGYDQQGYQDTGRPQQQMIYPPQAYGQQMVRNDVIVAGVGGMGMPAYQTAPQDYTTQAWLACLCCFWPTGLLAIMKANESREALARGDLVGANVAANSARQMVRISYIVGIISVVLSAIIFGVYFGVIINNINTYN